MVEICLENFTPIVFGIISQNIKIIIEATKMATIEINSSDIIPINNLFNFDVIKLIIVTFRISSANKIVAIIDAGFLINVSSILPTEDFFFIKSIWYLWREKMELSVIEKKADNKIRPNIKIINK